MKNVGFIGLGNMGGGMCKNLIKAGHSVTIFDTCGAALQRFEGQARLAKDVMEVFHNSDCIFFSLPSSEVVEAIMEQYFTQDLTGKIFVDTSTCYPMSTRKLAAQVKQMGGGFIDSPPNAGPAEADAGELILMVAGDKADIDAIDDLLQAISKEYGYVGPSGNAHLMKLAANFLGLSEAILLAQLFPVMAKFGLEPETVFDSLNNEIFANWIFGFYGDKYVNRNYRLDFALSLGTKDLKYVKRLYEELNIPGFTLDGALDLCRVTLQQQKEGEVLDFSHVGRTMYDLVKLDK